MTKAAPPVDLRPDHWVIVCDVLRQHIPDRTVLAFGSRATWTAKDYSDLDLAILDDGPLSLDTISALAEGFGESALPFKVDLVDWTRIDEDFREIIRRDGVPVSMFSGNRAANEAGRWPPSVRGGSSIGWPRMTLGDCIETNDETYKLSEAWSFVNYLDTGSITENRVSEIQCFITGKDKLPSRARRKVREGDIVYSTVRPIQKHFGIMRNNPENFLASTGFSVVRAKSNIAYTDFVYWFLTQDHIINQLQTIAEHSTSAYPSIKPADIKCLELTLPPLIEQRAIAHILGTLDDKIELNRRMNQTLEVIARAIFKDWFVDFGPVRAKMQGHDTGLPRHIADLFPDRFVDSEIGEIPEGWKMTSLGELIDLNPKRVLRKGTLAPYLDMASTPTEGHVPKNWTDRQFSSGMRFVNGDTLVARITPCFENGKAAYVDFLPNGCVGWGSTEYIVMRPKAPLPSVFAYCLARSQGFREFAIQNMTGTSGRQRVPAKSLYHFPLVAPPVEVGTGFGDLVRPLFRRASANACMSRVLAALRDTLLPKLVSGEIRVMKLNKPMKETADTGRKAVGETP